MSNIDNNMDLEQALNALRQTVAELENSQITLDKRMELYERAGELAILCRRRLTEAELKLSKINERLAEKKKAEA